MPSLHRGEGIRGPTWSMGSEVCPRAICKDPRAPVRERFPVSRVARLRPCVSPCGVPGRHAREETEMGWRPGKDVKSARRGFASGSLDVGSLLPLPGRMPWNPSPSPRSRRTMDRAPQWDSEVHRIRPESTRGLRPESRRPCGWRPRYRGWPPIHHCSHRFQGRRFPGPRRGNPRRVGRILLGHGRWEMGTSQGEPREWIPRGYRKGTRRGDGNPQITVLAWTLRDDERKSSTEADRPESA